MVPLSRHALAAGNVPSADVQIQSSRTDLSFTATTIYFERVLENTALNSNLSPLAKSPISPRRQ